MGIGSKPRRGIKLMISLTDVGEDGQYMSYVRGSHRAFHPYERFTRNNLDFEYCEKYLDQIDIVYTTGKAGDVFLFDSNGMHQGNRSTAAVRDAVFVEFTADCNDGNIWGTDLDRASIPESILSERTALHPFVDMKPKWERARGQKKRRGSTWMNSLEDPANWLPKRR